MSSKKNIYAEVDEQGRMIIPKKVLDRYGIKEGNRLLLSAENTEIKIHQPATHLIKIYI